MVVRQMLSKIETLHLCLEEQSTLCRFLETHAVQGSIIETSAVRVSIFKIKSLGQHCTTDPPQKSPDPSATWLRKLSFLVCHSYVIRML